MNEFINSLGDVRVFSTLDAKSGYWKDEVYEEDRDKNGVHKHRRLLCFICMPSELENAPETFQLVMDVIVATVKWPLALISLEDIIIFSKSPSEHVQHKRQVLCIS